MWSMVAMTAMAGALEERKVGLGVELPVNGLWVGQEGVALPVELSGRVQLGRRFAVAPRVGLSTSWSSDETVLSATSARVGTDVRWYPLSHGPVHLVGLGGANVRGSKVASFDTAVSADLHVGGGLEWTPSRHLALGLEASTPLVMMGQVSTGADIAKVWTVGVHGLDAVVAAHLWF